ncbi:hypothetical protein BC937DRAFT_93368 [Endogone sp. FLAS-F59071]|nr:hypothetical protein BC937DRAFT_93368 [Endogone sp. FLAS-F59071]|eukprot:RUS14769.1 hypothetical protein BC937DRAFT_93368 [Endogone sp. FLAS-F59071]
MNTNAQLIPTLPTTENDPRIASVDIFRPLDRIEPAKVLDPSVTPTAPSIPSASPHARSGNQLLASPRSAPTASPSSGKYYCAVCKKVFNNEATWNNHQNSAKHLSNVKEASRSSGDGRSKTSGKTRKGSEVLDRIDDFTSIIASESEKTVAILPEVSDARQKLKQADKISNTTPAIAAPVYWNVAKALHKYNYPQDTSIALQSLIRLLERCEQVPLTSSAAQETNETTPQLTFSQISMTLYLARLALARLCASYTIGVVAARCLYMQALEERWKLEIKKIESIAQSLRVLPSPELTIALETLIEGSGVLAKSSKLGAKPKDPNLVLHLVLREAALVHMRRLGEEDSAARAAEQRAVVLARLEGVMYESLALPWYAVDNLLAAAQAGFAEAPASPGPESANLELATPSDSERLNELESWWCVIAAMVLTIELEDFVREREIQQLIYKRQAIDLIQRETGSTLSRQESQSGFADLDFLLRLSCALRVRDHAYLSRSAVREAEHIALLLGTGADTDAEGWDPLPLICARRFLDPVQAMAAWERVVMMPLLLPDTIAVSGWIKHEVDRPIMANFAKM